MSGFTSWLDRTVRTICDRPDHLQRLAILGAGMAIYPAIGALIWIVWQGYDRTPALQAQSLAIMGIALFTAFGLFGLVVVSMLGTIKGLRLEGPGGLGMELNTTADDPNVGPATTRETSPFSKTPPAADCDPPASSTTVNVATAPTEADDKPAVEVTS